MIVGHDWGANIAATCALLRPEVFRAVAMLSVPYAPPAAPAHRGLRADRRRGRVLRLLLPGAGPREAEIEPDVRGWLAGVYAALSADTMPAPGAPDPHFVSRGGRMRDRFPAGRLPSWLTEDELDVYAGEFERTGLTGALNRYRNMDRDWPTSPPTTAPPSPSRPSSRAGAGRVHHLDERRDRGVPRTLPGLVSSHLLEGCGHWIQQERPEEVNRLLTEWLAALPDA